MRILLWHVHGSWTTAFVQGPTSTCCRCCPTADRTVWAAPVPGTGRTRVVERTPAQLADDDIDVVVLQRPEELDLARTWTGRTPGVDLPAVYLEHNAPHPHPVDSRHPLAERPGDPDRARHALQPAVLGQRPGAARTSSSTACSTRVRATPASCRGSRR